MTQSDRTEANYGYPSLYGKSPIFGWAIVALVVLLVSYLHHGYYLNSDKTKGSFEGQGIVLSCSPSTMYLELVSYCRIRTPGRNSPVVEKDDRIADVVITVRKRQLNGAKVGDSIPLSYSEGAPSPVDDEEGYSHWYAANPAPSYGWEVPVQVALWILAGWASYRTFLSFRRRSKIRPAVPARHALKGTDRVLVIVSSVLVFLSLGGAYLLYALFIAAGEYGPVAAVLSWIGVVVLSLVGLACLIGAGTTWSSARKGKTVSKSDDDGNTQNGTLDELSR